MSDNFYVFPASFTQQRIWFLEAMEPGTAFYNIPQTLKVNGKVETNVLKKALRKLVERHETLRTFFRSKDGVPVQVITEQVEVDIEQVVLEEGLTGIERDQKLKCMIQEESLAPFSISALPLFRVRLITLNSQEHIFILNMHHIISDAWSSGIFIEELLYYYDKCLNGEKPSLEELPIQYADYAEWQTEWLDSEEMKLQLKYWEKQLHHAPSVLELPTDFPRPAVQSYQGATEIIDLDPSLVSGIREFSNRLGVTMFMSLFTGFNILLKKYSHQDDILIGTPIAGRNKKELEKIIGFFANTIVLRTNLSGNPTVEELLHKTKFNSINSYSNQEYPFDKLVEKLNPERNLSYNPIFQVMFAYQNAPKPKLTAEDLMMEYSYMETGTSKFDISLSLIEKKETLTCMFEYNTDLFTGNTIKQMLRHYINILESMIIAPEQKIEEMMILGQEEQTHLLNNWNQTDMAVNWGKLVPHRIEQQVHKTPNKVAVKFKGSYLTYEQLNLKANQFARFLQKKGVVKNALVGIFIERSLDMAVGVLGILKAGAAYVPIDPKYPEDRVNYIIEDSKMEYLVTQECLKNRLSYQGINMICVDSDQYRHVSDKNLNTNIVASDLAYVIYTSGSTGKPKGVLIEHGNMLHHHLAMIKEFSLCTEDRILQFSSISFDIAVEEIFPTWIVGATLILREEEVITDPVVFRDWIEHHQITILNLPTAFWQEWIYALVEEGEKFPEHVRTMIVGGEKISPAALERWHQLNTTSIEWFNAYGPTETTVTCTVYKLKPVDFDYHRVPIGKPIANTKVYILDDRLQPVPKGVRGELYIGGAGVARGYLNRPGMSEERFIKNPFDLNNDKLYKTGDIARFLPNGEIDFLGRNDDQVKLRGFRIEIGEVESAINTHPNIKESLVLTCQHDQQTKLVAYVICDSIINECECKTYLSNKLPSYMVPSKFIFISKFPTTPNGKVDSQALPKPSWSTIKLNQKVKLPLNEIETALVEVWCDVLQLEQISVVDNFFELGGDSILIIQLISKARKKDIYFTAKQLFQFQNVRELAKHVNKTDQTRAEQELVVKSNSTMFSKVPLVSGDYSSMKKIIKTYSKSKDIYGMTPMQQTMLTHHLNHPDSMAFQQQFHVKITGDFDVEVFKEAWERTVERHDILKTSFEWIGVEIPLQIVHKSGQLDWSYSDLSGTVSEGLETKINQYLQQRRKVKYDFKKPTLMRIAMIRANKQEYRFIWEYHQMLIDGWCISVILNEVFELYKSKVENKKPYLLPVSDFREYIAWLNEQSRDRARRYWENILGSFEWEKRKLEEKVSYDEKDYVTQLIEMEEEETSKIIAWAKRNHITLNSVIQVAWASTLCFLTQQNKVSFGVTFSGRPAELDHVERKIGLFINSLPIYVNFSEDDNILSLAIDIQRQNIDMQYYGYVSQESIKKWCKLDNNKCLFDSVIHFQNYPKIDYIGGLDLEYETLASVGFNPEALALYVNSGEKLCMKIVSNTTKVSPTFINHLVMQFEETLRLIIRKEKNFSIKHLVEDYQLM
ncbi:amino acid adenylation domain-containing protein [Marininema mesophilum]|uniref:Amino acid adenylation domain-containing protein n=1 Tax=Marininema mesophilum TaxID=1048340 RepID=A0A1H2YGW4_9BACL|nr:non-ribosomal peptide synthetase [Marininema mesophilum]SDX04417.1 amino acid adenylation domain-containing protein [Marininema mesophilum]